MFSSRISPRSIAILCRSLATLLHSGIPILKVFQTASTKTGDRRATAALEHITDRIRSGHEIAEAMREQSERWPELVIDMVELAEKSGALPEILFGLADHYENLIRLRKNFLYSIAWPVFQMLAAILVIAGVILILGWIESSRGGGLKILWGLRGPEGAAIWLLCSFGSILSLFTAYRLIAGSVGGRKFLHPFLLNLPVIGGCMRSFAIARFSWAFYLTQQTGMRLDRSLEASLRATNNGAFQAATPIVCSKVNAGESLSTALAAAELFPIDFLQMVEVAETSGTVPETLHRLSPQFEDQARRSLQTLASALSWLIWCCVAGFIIFLIFSIFMQYIAMINDAAKAA